MRQQNALFAILLIIAIITAACQTQANPTPEVLETATDAATDTPAPTQTPFVIVVTATSQPTLPPTRTPDPSATPTQNNVVTNPILDNCALRTDWPLYTVVVGDTLSNLAVRTNSTVTNLQLANCISDANVIRVGQQLRVPQLPDPAEVIVEDLISAFSADVSEAQVGDTVTFTWAAEAATIIEIENETSGGFIGV